MTIAGCQFEGISVSEGINKIKRCLDEMLEEGELQSETVFHICRSLNKKKGIFDQNENYFITGCKNIR